MQYLMPVSVLCRLSRKCLFRATLSACAMTCSSLCAALDFDFINSGAIPLSKKEITAVEQAGRLWSKEFRDPITVRINVEWRPKSFFVSDSILASVQIGRTSAPMAMVRDSLMAEAAPSEQALMSALPLAVPIAHASIATDDVSLTLANAKALGITPANDPHFGKALDNNADAHISLNLKYAQHFFYPQSQVESGKYDFTGVLAHEIGHALGFTSIVDVQAMNPGTMLNPMLLDVFRFPSGSSNPSISNDTRQTLPAFAQFFDGVLPYASLGSGFDVYDPFYCALPSKRCSASHWDDMSGNLMTSASKETQMDIALDDAHSVDRIGVDAEWRNGIPLIKVKAEFYDANSSVPSYDRNLFDTQTEAPHIGNITPNFSASPTHAFHLSFDGHAATGYAVFEKSRENHSIPAVDFVPKDAERSFNRQWEAEPAVEDLHHFPPRFTHFYFESKNSRYRFKFVSTFSNYGAIFDEALGSFGGFRISGFLDGDLDGDYVESAKENRDDNGRNDVDASITMLLLMQKPHDIKNGIVGVPFAIEWQGKKQVKDNILHLIDSSAFGAPASYNNSSSYKEAWNLRVEQLEGDTEPGRDIAL